MIAWAAVMVAVIAGIVSLGLGLGRADTPTLRVFTDGATGCQYLTAGRSGSLVARTDGQGTHLGCEAVKRVGGPGS